LKLNNRLVMLAEAVFRYAFLPAENRQALSDHSSSIFSGPDSGDQLEPYFSQLNSNPFKQLVPVGILV
jgi:hypothetical protein